MKQKVLVFIRDAKTRVQDLLTLNKTIAKLTFHEKQAKVRSAIHKLELEKVYDYIQDGSIHPDRLIDNDPPSSAFVFGRILEYAELYGTIEMFKALLEKGANPNLCCHLDAWALSSHRKRKHVYFERLVYMSTYEALNKDRYEFLKAYLDYGGKGINEIYLDGTITAELCRRSTTPNIKRTIFLLLTKGARFTETDWFKYKNSPCDPSHLCFYEISLMIFIMATRSSSEFRRFPDEIMRMIRGYLY